MTEFKIGDKVRRLYSNNGKHREGTIDTIYSIHPDDSWPGFYCENNNDCWCDANNYELVDRQYGEPVTTGYMVDPDKFAAAPDAGAKYDAGKPLFRALTRGLALPLRAVAAVLTYGAIKYKEDSWQQVPNGKARYESALDRHLNDWKAGETYDAESGLPHLAHAACNALFILWFELTDGSVTKDYTKFNIPPRND
jgi:Domain of unknown function (DUF5664)